MNIKNVFLDKKLFHRTFCLTGDFPAASPPDSSANTRTKTDKITRRHGQANAVRLTGQQEFDPMASRKILKVMHSARQGDAAAQLELGRCYLDGAEGLGRNLPTAYRWLSAAADQGCDEAACLIADAIPLAAIDNPARARWHLQRACALGSVAAGSKLARWQLDGLFGPLAGEDIARCRDVLRSAAEQGDVLAQLTLGALALDSGSDNGNDIAWLEQAAQRGENEAMLRLIDYYWQCAGGELWTPGQVPGISRQARPAAAIAAAEKALAWHRASWDKTRQTLPGEEILRRASLLLLLRQKDAGKWLEKAADAGEARAAYILGLINLGPSYVDGLIGHEAGAAYRFPRSYKQAESWLTRAADMQIAEASFAVWMVNNFRNYTLKDPAKGARHLVRAAQMGHGEACWLLAKGHLAKDNGQEAIRWLERAARQGLDKAERKLDELAPRVAAPDSHLLALSQALENEDSSLSVRLELAAHFALKEAEYLLIDPNIADLGDVICVDIRRHYRKSKVRLIRITDASQRQALDRAKHLLASLSSADEVDYQSLKRRAQGKIARVCGGSLRRQRTVNLDFVWGTSPYF